MISGMWMHTVIWKDNVAFANAVNKKVTYSFGDPSLSEFLVSLAEQDVKDVTVITELYPFQEVPD